jgi:hypothetical protein
MQNASMPPKVTQTCRQTVFCMTSKAFQDHFFQGYAFVGADLVFGADGLRDFTRATCQELGPGEDGCYVQIHREGTRFRVGTDHSGFKKVFYYWSPGFWVVSNSILAITDALHTNGITVTPRLSQLAAITVPRTFFQQPYSFQTIVTGVQILPLGHELMIGDENVSIKPYRPRPLPDSYAAALAQFTDLWIARFETLVANETVQLSADLTGGVDSRTVFTLIRAAQRRLGLRRARFFCSGAGLDFQVAQRVCTAFEERLHNGMPVNHHALSCTEAYETWRALDLGAYHPVYFPFTTPGLHVVRVGGNGGEIHRPFYNKSHSYADLASFIRAQGDTIHPDRLRAEFAQDTQDWMQWVEQNEANKFWGRVKWGRLRRLIQDKRRLEKLDKTQALITHYREFRNRFHSGRVPQSHMGFHPLSSGFLDDVSALAGAERLSSSQILFDIMHQLEPGVVLIPFDTPEKSPTDANLTALTPVEVGRNPAPGRIYGTSPDPTSPSHSGAHPLQRLLSDVETAQQADIVQQLFAPDQVSTLLTSLRDASVQGGRSHAKDGLLASAVLSAAAMIPNNHR